MKLKETVLSRSIRLICSGGMAVGIGMLALPALAQETAPTQRVEITGSSIKRIAAESALPVTTLSKEDIDKSGVQSVEALLQTLSAASSSGATTGSTLAGSASYGLSSVSLRGLGESRTLVLVNGKRMASFAGTGTAVDVNSIPLSAIERVEVLRDGASGVYGSDAIAGVVNFILRDNFQGFSGEVSYDTPTMKGGGMTKKAGITLGVGDLSADKYNFMLAVDLEKADALFSKDRDFANTAVKRPYFDKGATGTGNIEGVWFNGQTQAQASANANGYKGSGYGNPMNPGNCAAIGMYASGKNCNYNTGPDVGLFPEYERANLLGSFKLQLTPDTQFFADAMFSQNRVKETYQPSPAKAAFFSTDNAFDGSGVSPALIVQPTNPYYQSIISPWLQANGLAAMDGKPLAVSQRTFLLGRRQEVDTNTQARLNLGLKGAINSNWDYNTSFTASQSNTRGRVTDGYFSQLGLAQILNDPNSNWNPYAPNGVQDPALQAKLDGIKYRGATIGAESTSTGVDAAVSGTLMDLPAGPLQLATGVSFRRDTYEVTVPDIALSGDIAGLGGATLPINASRVVSSVFGELNVPIVKMLEANLSVRADKYSDVGGTVNSKAGLRFTPTKDLLFRASYGTGFRAPSLVELHKPQSLGVSEIFTDPVGGPGWQANSLIGGNPDLKSEKSKQFNLGVVVQPINNLSIGVDYFHIKIDNMIAAPSALALVNATLAGHPLYGPNDVVFDTDGTVLQVDQTSRNVNQATVSGYDVDVRFKQAFSAGKLSVNLNGTYTNQYDYKTLAGTQSAVGTLVQPDGSPLDVAVTGGVVLRWKHTLAASWTTGPWTGTVIQNFASGYHDAPDLDGKPHDVPSLTTYDAQVAYLGIKNLTLTAGVRNLFNKEPPLVIGVSNYFGAGFDPTQYDARGRAVYLKANYKFY